LFEVRVLFDNFIDKFKKTIEIFHLLFVGQLRVGDFVQTVVFLLQLLLFNIDKYLV
jgi:hypothetical protein